MSALIRETMLLRSLPVALVALALPSGAGSSVPPPTHPGAWHQVGPALTSRVGKPVHFVRSPQDPTAIGVVARSSSAKPIRVTWFSYCEEQSDDGMTDQHQGTSKGVGLVTVYPPVFAGATLCNVSVVATPPKLGKVVAAAFVY
jgi:hypothetical protein